MTDEEIKKMFEIQRKIDEKRQKKAVFYQNLPKSAVFEIPAGKHGKSQISPVESTFLKIEQLEKEITDLENRLQQTKLKLIKAFDKNLPPEISLVFIWRYVACKQWKKIMAEMNYSEGHIHKLHKQGKEILKGLEK